MNSANQSVPPGPAGKFDPNPDGALGEFPERHFADRWPSQDTAVLVVHGIGNQEPFDTLDQFARTLVETLRAGGRDAITMTHMTAMKPSRSSGGFWYDNFIRLAIGPERPHVDIFEYYWAYQTEGKASLGDIQNWVAQVTRGAEKFYRENEGLGQRYGGDSLFFRKHRPGANASPRGGFRPLRYWFFIATVAHVIPAALGAVTGTLGFLSKVPIVGWSFDWLLRWVERREVNALANVVGDIAIYNTTDAKSRFYAVHKAILDGAVNALRYLLQPASANGPYRPEDWRYDRVILAGHSLGSQISFDAINRLNHLIHQGELRGCDRSGYFTDGTAPLRTQSGGHISEMLCGLVTFGSPLDKMAFFFREQTEKEQYLRSQIIEHFHGFKQRPWSLQQTDGAKRLLATPQLFSRLFDDIRWRNYHDRGDLVSGSLDYYEKVANVDCRFQPSLSLGEFWTVLSLCVVIAALVLWWMARIWNPGQWVALFLYGTGAELTEKLRQLSAADVWLLVFCLLLLAGAAAVPLMAFAARFTHSNYWNCRRMFADIVDRFILPVEPTRHDPQSNGDDGNGAAGAVPKLGCPHAHRQLSGDSKGIDSPAD
ncbi:MAG TPA: hypothetical protein VN887_09555 [Candidatus Angelobacter sp.]|nr:hypothetical protein [Candidatus Angelobacter sp.]